MIEGLRTTDGPGLTEGLAHINRLAVSGAISVPSQRGERFGWSFVGFICVLVAAVGCIALAALVL